jgi:hypothetical protein
VTLCDGKLGVLLLEVMDCSCLLPFIPWSEGTDAEDSFSSCFMAKSKIPNTMMLSLMTACPALVQTALTEINHNER